MTVSKKADSIRDVIRYLQKFKGAVIVIYLDDKIIHSSLFALHIRDIALLHQAGLKVVIIPGARARIDEVLSSNGIKWSYKNNIRVTQEDAMPLVKMAAFDVSNTVMTNLAANGITAVIGNWVRSRAKGVVEGYDFGTAGEIDRLDTASLQTILTDGFIPIFPCIGWNSVGHPYNISSIVLAQQVAVELKADKLFFVMGEGDSVSIKKNGEVVPAMNIEELDEYAAELKNGASDSEQVLNILNLAKQACCNGVNRTHLLDGNIEGVFLTEIFSDLGSGTMIYTSNYGKIRQMQQSDIPSVLALMQPFIQNGKLLPRTQSNLQQNLKEYIVYELDGGIRACAALHIYSDGQAEISAIAVDEAFGHMGIGPALTQKLISQAKEQNVVSIFIMTTQASDWFEKLGFSPDVIESLPPERLKKWTPERNSKVYRLK